MKRVTKQFVFVIAFTLSTVYAGSINASSNGTTEADIHSPTETSDSIPSVDLEELVFTQKHCHGS